MSIDETSFIMGSRSVWRHLLSLALQDLGYSDKYMEKLNWIAEREDIINRLRSVCAEFGDNDWSNDLHLGDVIDKHLAPYLGK